MTADIDPEDTIRIDTEAFSGSLFDITDKTDESLGLFDVTVLTAAERSSDSAIVMRRTSVGDEWAVRTIDDETEYAIPNGAVTVVGE